MRVDIAYRSTALSPEAIKHPSTSFGTRLENGLSTLPSSARNNTSVISRHTLIKGAATLGTLGAIGTLGLCGALASNDPLQVDIVAKIRIPWFDNVEKGVLAAGKYLGVNAWMIAPTTDDAAQQVRAVEDLIAKKVDVIEVIPNDGAVLEPVFKRAKDAGIIVITKEQAAQKNPDWDFELIRDTAFGQAHMEPFGEA